MNPMEFISGKNRLAFLILPPLLSLSLISIVKPSGSFAFVVELVIICLCGFVCGFALAVKSFATSRQRVWGGLIFTACNLYLVSCVAFLGCMTRGNTPPPLTPAQIENARREQFRLKKERMARDGHIVPRDAAADSSMLDLSPFYNELLPGQRLPTDVSRSYLNPGIHIWQGIKFDVRGEIDSGGTDYDDPDPIPVGQKCSEVDFLLGSNLLWQNGETNCQMVIHFANGTKATVPIIYGKDMALSHFSDVYPRNSSVLTNSVVWEESIYANAPLHPVFGFYIKRWENPFPDEIVTVIDFKKNHHVGAFLVAITLQPKKKENQ